MYGSPDEFEKDEPPVPLPSPETNKRQHAELEAEIDEISTGSDEYDATGKTPEQVDETLNIPKDLFFLKK